MTDAMVENILDLVVDKIEEWPNRSQKPRTRLPRDFHWTDEYDDHEWSIFCEKNGGLFITKSQFLKRKNREKKASESRFETFGHFVSDGLCDFFAVNPEHSEYLRDALNDKKFS